MHPESITVPKTSKSGVERRELVVETCMSASAEMLEKVQAPESPKISAERPEGQGDRTDGQDERKESWGNCRKRMLVGDICT